MSYLFLSCTENIFIKTGNKKNSELGQVFHYDVFGKREEKYNFLSETNLNDINFNEIKPVGKQYYFIPQDMTLKSIYEKGITYQRLRPIQSYRWRNFATWIEPIY